MRRLLLILIIGAAATTWWIEKARTAELETKIEALASADRTRASLLDQQRQLRRLLPSQAERNQLVAASAEAANLEKAIATARPSPTKSLAISAIGEWSPVATWQNRGTAVPRDTVESALWAAVSGDIVQLAQLLELAPDVRAQAEALLARLPAEAQAQFPTPETLIAAFTIKSIPVGPAQIVWSQQSDPDNATVCVFIRNPNVAPAPISIVPAHLEDEAAATPKMTREEAVALALRKAEARKRTQPVPPTISPNAHTTLAYLAVRRTDAGWRLAVPASAIAKIAHELTAPAPSP